MIAPPRFDDPLPPRFAARMREAGLMNGNQPRPSIADFVIPQVLALSYTAHDLGALALDALFMHLYGIGEGDAPHILDSFPIVREQDEAAFGRHRTKDDVLALLRDAGAQG